MPGIFNSALPFVLPPARPVALLRWRTDPQGIPILRLLLAGTASIDLARYLIDAVASAKE
jgi:hypothetical protein